MSVYAQEYTQHSNAYRSGVYRCRLQIRGSMCFTKCPLIDVFSSLVLASISCAHLPDTHTLNLLTLLPSCSHFSDLQQEYYNISAPRKSLWQGRAALHLSTGTPHSLSSSLSFYHTLLICTLFLPASLGDRDMASHQHGRTSTAVLSPGCVFFNFP